MMRELGFALIFTMSLGGCAATQPDDFMDSDAIQDAVSGTEIHGCYRPDYGTERFSERLAADGSVYDLSATGNPRTGRWAAQNDRLCFFYGPPNPDDPGACFRVMRVGAALHFYGDGETTPIATSTCPYEAA